MSARDKWWHHNRPSGTAAGSTLRCRASTSKYGSAAQEAWSPMTYRRRRARVTATLRRFGACVANARAAAPPRPPPRTRTITSASLPCMVCTVPTHFLRSSAEHASPKTSRCTPAASAATWRNGLSTRTCETPTPVAANSCSSSRSRSPSAGTQWPRTSPDLASNQRSRPGNGLESRVPKTISPS